MNTSDYRFLIKPTWRYAVLNAISLLLLIPAMHMAFMLVPVNQDMSLFFVAFYFFVFAFITYKVFYTRHTKYYIYSDHLMYKRGLIGIKEDFLQYYRIKDIRVQKSIWMRVLGLMEIRLVTSDKTHKLMYIKGIEANDFSQVLRAQVEKARLESGVFEVDNK